MTGILRQQTRSEIDLVLRTLDRGYHACSAVPALLGREQLDRAPKLIEAVTKTGLVYEMFETTTASSRVSSSCAIKRRLSEPLRMTVFQLSV